VPESRRLTIEKLIYERKRKMKERVMRFVRNQKGLTTVEYAVAGGLVALAVVLAFQALGVQVGAVITQITAAITP
jgi:pilus assembly protein Flp/PilA